MSETESVWSSQHMSRKVSKCLEYSSCLEKLTKNLKQSICIWKSQHIYETANVWNSPHVSEKIRIFLGKLASVWNCFLSHSPSHEKAKGCMTNCYFMPYEIFLGYRLDVRGSRVRFPVGAGNFSLHHCVQNGSGAHLASCPVGTGGSFPGGKVAGV
jgi:hypothetical protein